MTLSKILLSALMLGCGSAMAADDIPAAARHVAIARKLAGEDLKTPLFLCEAHGNRVIGEAMNNLKNWRKPAKLLDNLYFIGNGFVGAYIVKTSEGLILFDTLTSEEDVREHLVPGLTELGLDPKTIKYAIATHGHWDHFGGGPALQRMYGTHIALSAADWDLMVRLPADSPEIAKHETPQHDVVIADGQKLTLGDTTITLFVTPGHSPGTLSALIPVRDHGKVRVFSLLGGTAFPGTVGPNEHTAGLKAFDQSVQRLARASGAAGAVGILNTHAFADGGLARMDAVLAQGNGAPMVIGTDGVRRYYGVFDQCLQAALARAAAAPSRADQPYE